jgi:hypothetical protein
MAGIYSEFLSHINTRGVAKVSHFIASMPALTDKLGLNPRDLPLRCESAELPGRQLVTQDVKIYGPVYKVPYQSLYQDIILTFLENDTLGIRTLFELWMDRIFDSSTNILSYPNRYRVDMQVTQYDVVSSAENSTGLDEVATWNLFNAFPLSINQMPLSWTEDGFHRTTVTFAYEYYTISKPNSGANIPTGPVQVPQRVLDASSEQDGFIV